MPLRFQSSELEPMGACALPRAGEQGKTFQKARSPGHRLTGQSPKKSSFCQSEEIRRRFGCETRPYQCECQEDTIFRVGNYGSDDRSLSLRYPGDSGEDGPTATVGVILEKDCPMWPGPGRPGEMLSDEWLGLDITPRWRLKLPDGRPSDQNGMAAATLPVLQWESKTTVRGRCDFHHICRLQAPRKCFQVIGGELVPSAPGTRHRENHIMSARAQWMATVAGTVVGTGGWIFGLGNLIWHEHPQWPVLSLTIAGSYCLHDGSYRTASAPRYP